MKGFLVMSEYNFKPDYEDWWKRKTLKMEDVIWLILGINPNDVNCYREYEISNKPKDPWYWAFYNYVELIYPGRRIGEYYSIYSKILDGVKKKDAFQIIYNHHNPIHSDALSFAKSHGLIKTEEKLEKYTDHNLFILDCNKFAPSFVTTEIQALGALLGFSPSYFERYKGLFDKVQDEINRVGYFYLYSLTSEERWFYDEFTKCIIEQCDEHDPIFLFDKLNHLTNLKIWKNDFPLYVQESYEEGFSFDQDVYNALFQVGISMPEYKKDSWAIKYYEEWIKRKPVWDAITASCLYRGGNPDEGREFWNFNKKKNLKMNGYYLYTDYLSYSSEDGKIKEQIKIIDFIHQHILAGNLKENGKDNEGKYLFNPKEITIFFRDYCPNSYQPIALFEALGIKNENNNSQELNLEPSHKEYDFTAIPKKDRESIVLDYALKIWQSNNYPKIGWVHREIENNPCFKIGKTRWATICKPVTEKKLAELVSRKNAEKRGKNTF